MGKDVQVRMANGRKKKRGKTRMHIEHNEDEKLHCPICDGTQLDGSQSIENIITEISSTRTSILKKLGEINGMLFPLRKRHQEIMSLHPSCAACSILIGAGHVEQHAVEYQDQSYCPSCAAATAKRDKHEEGTKCEESD